MNQKTISVEEAETGELIVTVHHEFTPVGSGDVEKHVIEPPFDLNLRPTTNSEDLNSSVQKTEVVGDVDISVEDFGE